MPTRKSTVYPFIPNSLPSVKEDMLRYIGAANIEDLYREIPPELRLDRPLDLPGPYLSEQALRRHVEDLLARNRTCQEFLSFLGAGCWPHYVPAVCDEINSRSEFLTAYAGEPYEDHGRFQALFEYASMMGELVEMDVVSIPTYDGYQAAVTALRMAGRINGRRQVLVPASIGRDKLSKFRDYCQPLLDVTPIAFDPATGLLDLDDLRRHLSGDTAAVYLEVPSYLGVLEASAAEIGRLAHECGAEFVVEVDPITLGVIAPPSAYGADIVCGDLQPLGMHMQYGGGHAGFLATRDEVRYVREYPSRLFGIAPTAVEGEYGFGDVFYERTSFAKREQGNEWVGTAAALWGITAGVYMALIGPQGFAELGQLILQRSHYAAQRLGQLPGVHCPALTAAHFKEFVVNFDGTGRSVSELHAALQAHGIFGGKDLSAEFPALGQSALYCVTEVHTQQDIDRLTSALEEVLR